MTQVVGGSSVGGRAPVDRWLRAALVVWPVLVVVAVDPWGWFPFGPLRWLVVSAGVPVLLALAARRTLVVVPRIQWLSLATILAMALAAAVAGEGWLPWIGTEDRHLGVAAWVLFAAAVVVGQSLGPRLVDALAGGLAVAGLALGAVATTGALGWEPRLLDVDDRLTATFGSPAYLGAATALLLPVVVALAVGRRGPRWRRVVARIALPLVVVAAVGSGARAAWLGLAVAAVVTALVNRRVLVATLLGPSPGPPPGGSTGPSRDSIGPRGPRGVLVADLGAESGPARQVGARQGFAGRWPGRTRQDRRGRRDRRDRDRRHRWPRRRVAVVGLGLAVGLVALVALTPMGERIGALGDPSRAGGASRLDEWRVAVTALAERPVVGAGPEGYRVVFPGAVDADYVRAHGREVAVDRAHAAPLDVALAGGAFAMVAWGAWLVAVAPFVGRGLRWPVGGAGAGAGAGAGVGVAGAGAGAGVVDLDVDVDVVVGRTEEGITAGAALADEEIAAARARPVAGAGSTGHDRSVVVGLAAGVVAYLGAQLLLFPLAELDPLAWLMAGAVVGATARSGELRSGDGPSGEVRPEDARSGEARSGEARPWIAGRWLPALAAAVAVVALVAGGAAVVADQRARRATSRAADGDPILALAEVDAALAWRPDGVRLRLLRADLALAAGRGTTEAIASVDEALRWAPGDPVVARRRAELVVARAEATLVPTHLDDARRTVDERVAADPHDPALWVLAARVAVLDGRPDDAAADLARALDLDPDHAEARAGRDRLEGSR